MGCCSATAEGAQETGTGDEFHRRYVLGIKLGEGSFGQVRAIWVRGSREHRAVKVVRLQDAYDCIDTTLLASVRREARIWRQLGQHEHCVALHEAFIDYNLYYMVMERCEASLMDQLQEMPRMGEGRIACVFREMLMGIRHLHSQHVVHRDVKPNNFLFGGPTGGTVKLCDFGMAARLPRNGSLLFGRYGTAPYMSPEMVGAKGHDLSTDAWSFGATTYVLLYGDFPYLPDVPNGDFPVRPTAKAMKQAVLDGVPAPTFKRSFPDMKPPSELAQAFVRQLLNRVPRSRPSVEQAMALPFVRRELSLSRSAEVGTGHQQRVEQVASVDAKVPAAGGQRQQATAKQGGNSGERIGFGQSKSLASFEDGLAPIIRRARLRTHQFEKPANPTVQHSLDELLKRLQEKSREKGFSRSFSDPGGAALDASAKEAAEEEEVAGPIVHRKESKCSTHTGVLDGSKDGSWDSIIAILDNQSIQI